MLNKPPFIIHGGEDAPFSLSRKHIAADIQQYGTVPFIDTIEQPAFMHREMSIMVVTRGGFLPLPPSMPSYYGPFVPRGYCRFLDHFKI